MMNVICSGCSKRDETTFDAKLMKFQTRIKFCCRNRCWGYIPDRNISMNCSYQSVWSTRGMLFQLPRDGSSDRTWKLIARVTHIRSRHAQFVYFFFNHTFSQNEILAPFAVSIALAIVENLAMKRNCFF